MRILLLGNSFTTANGMPRMLAGITGAEVVCHTRGGARLVEHLNESTRLGARTQKALQEETWDYVVLQEMSHGPFTATERFFSSVERLCSQIRQHGAVPVLYATWAYEKGGSKLAGKGWDYEEMARAMSAAYGKAARDNGALLANVGQRFYQRSQREQLYAADGVHPNEQGSRLAAETIGQVILEHKENMK
ncbi:SGNH/GDSL hydrolase family protein [Ruminococcaceae bacterium AM07-15]|nr:SGNH/GDSL hydrolase family protein [Ruminococcaceae bacterium AM07-15]